MLFAYQGWSMGRFGVERTHLFLSIGMLALLLFVRYRHMRLFSPKRIACSLSLSSGILVLSFIAVFLIGRTNFLRFNTWIDGSVKYLKIMIDPVLFAAESPAHYRAMLLDIPHAENAEEKFSRLQINDDVAVPRMIISFMREGLALLDGQKITPLFGNVFLSSVQPDNTLILYSRDTPRILTKAVLRGDTLYKIWERHITGFRPDHWGDVYEGEIYLPGMSRMNLPNDLSKSIGYSFARCSVSKAFNDIINVYDFSTGELKRTIEILPLIAALGEEGMDIHKKLTVCNDPLHTNRVHIVREEGQAGYFPNGKVGDLLISLRNPNTIALLDGDTYAIKWHMTGGFRRQHEPVITDHGTIILFDNFGSDQRNGRSRIVEMDIASHKMVGMWEASGKDYFESEIRGKVKILDDHRLLVQEESPFGNDASMFVLDCPGPHVSSDCQKSLVFKGNNGSFRYENVEILQEDA
jgi:hypothetical protein